MRAIPAVAFVAATFLFVGTMRAISTAGFMPATHGTVAQWEPDFGIEYSMAITASAEAQRYFDAGLLHMYGFNCAEARKAFDASVAADATCAMCHWGVAFACGPTSNDGSNKDAVTGYQEAQRAKSLSDAASAHGLALPIVEAGLIDAMLVRYTPEFSAEEGWRAYAEELDTLRARFATPNDDVETFYADQLMCIHALNYYENETMEAHGSITTDAGVALSVLEGVLGRSDNPFAEHLYIHIAEPLAPDDPGLAKGERVADRLFTSGLTGSGHLLHMPGHLFNRVGRFAESVTANIHAYNADQLYDEHGAQPYIAGHNLDFLVWSAEMDGQSATALKYAEIMGDGARKLTTLLRYGDFTAVLQGYDAACASATGPWWQRPLLNCHYARGMALVATGDATGAAVELAELQRNLRPDEGCSEYWTVSGCLANKTLAARLALFHGDGDAAIALLERGVVEEAHVPYDEPPPWHYPTRECLGAVLLTLGRAAESEAVYRRDLVVWRDNAWSLRGLADAMAAQPDKYSQADIDEVLAQLHDRWARGDRPLTASCMAFALSSKASSLVV